MKWTASKAVATRCAAGISWSKEFARQFAKLPRTVSFGVSRYRDVVGYGLTRSTFGVPHTIKIYLNTACDGGALMWQERSVHVPRAILTEGGFGAAEDAAKLQVADGQLLGAMYVAGARVRFETWGRYVAVNLGTAAVWIFTHEAWHWLTRTRQVNGANSEQNANAAACRVSDMYCAGESWGAAAAFLRRHAHDIAHPSIE